MTPGGDSPCTVEKRNSVVEGIHSRAAGGPCYGYCINALLTIGGTARGSGQPLAERAARTVGRTGARGRCGATERLGSR